MDINLTIDGLDRVQLALGGFSERRINAAVATAMTRTVRSLAVLWQDQISERIDEPNPRTQKAVFVQGATATTLEARVALKDRMTGAAPADYLFQHEFGGKRLIKQFERALINSGAMPPGYFTVPGRAAVRDAYGNVSKAQIIAVISQLGQDYSPGYAQTISKSTAKRLASQARHGRRYIVVRPAEARRANADPGVYERMGDGARHAIFLFKQKVTYAKRLDLEQRGLEAAGRLIDVEVGRAIEASAARLSAREAGL